MEEKFEDKILICKDTGKEFVFTAGEQKFYKERGFQEPVRCKEAREARKQARMNQQNDEW